VIGLKIMIAKFSPWSYDIYCSSEHPEIVAIRDLASQNRQHNFVLVAEGGGRYEHFHRNGISFYNIGSNSRIRFLVNYLLAYLVKFVLAIVLRPSVIVSMGTINVVPFGISSLLTRARFIPVVTGEIWYEISQFPRPLKGVCTFLLKVTFKKAYAILAISESVRKEIRDTCGIDQTRVFAYEYKIPRVFNPSVSRSLRMTLNPKGKIVLTICRIHPQKGLEYLVEASRIVVKAMTDAKFVIKAHSSEKNYEKKLLSMINKFNLQRYYVILKENVPYSELPKYMRAADVFVLPSISEALGVVLLEAMASGVPVVATRIGGIADIIIHEHNGLLFEPRDVEGLASAIVRVLKDERLSKRLIEGGLATVRCVGENEFGDLLSRFSLFGLDQHRTSQNTNPQTGKCDGYFK